MIGELLRRKNNSDPDPERRRQLEMMGPSGGIRRYINPRLKDVGGNITDYPKMFGDDLPSIAKVVFTNLDEISRMGGAAHLLGPHRDAVSMYLGLPQAGNSIQPSSYAPSESTDPEADYFTMPGFLREKLARVSPEKVVKAVQEGRKDGSILTPPGTATDRDLVLANYKVDAGQDGSGHYISMYDLYDFDIPLEREGAGVGKPFEIYDRVYYDPETFEPLPEDGVIGEMVRRKRAAGHSYPTR